MEAAATGADSCFSSVLVSALASVIGAAAFLPPPETIPETSVPAGPIMAKILSTSAASPSATP